MSKLQRRLFETAKDGILILDAQTGMIVDVNPFTVELLGFPHESFLGKKVWELGFFKDIVANEANFAELQQKEYVRYEDMPMETSDGRRIEAEFASNVYLVDNQKVIQCNIRNVTDRVQAEAAVRESEQRYRSLVEVSPDAIFINRENQIVFINAAGLKLLGATNPAQVLGRSPLNFFHPDCHPLIQERIRVLLEKKLATPLVENKLLRLDGAVVSVEITAVPFEDRGVTSIQVVVRDITQRKRAEADLRASGKRFDRLAAQLNDIVWTASIDGTKLRDVNDSFERVYGVRVAELLARPRLWIEMVHPEDRAIAEASEEQLFKTGQAQAEYRIVRPDGDGRWILDRKTLIYDDQDRPVEMGGVAKDITERKLAEEEIHKLNAELEQRVQERTRQLAEANQELAAFNQTMVDRELRIIEMKEEVNALCRELGREPEYPPVWEKGVEL